MHLRCMKEYLRICSGSQPHNFLCVNFMLFFQRIQTRHQILLFWYPYRGYLKKKHCFGYISSLCQLLSQMRVKRLKKLKNVFYVLRIRDVYPGSRILILPIPDPGSRIQKQLQKRGMKKNLLSYLSCSHKCHKIKIIELLKKKIWAKFQRIMELFTQKVVTKLSKICLFRIPDQ